MDSSNKIAPLEIETLETISSELANQNNPPAFSKTEHSSVQKISNATNNEPDSIHYITWLFGILLTCATLISTLIVPWHNVLKEPFYWYEMYVYNAPNWIALLSANYIMKVEYWGGIIFDKKMNLLFYLIGIGGLIYAFIVLSYYYICVYYYELFAPLPMGGRIPGALFVLVFLIPLIFFRYCHT